MKGSLSATSLLASRLSVLLPLVLITGCQTSHIVVGDTRQPISPKEVKVFTQPPQVAFERVAEITTDSSWALTLGNQSKINKVLERLKKDAAKLGANGIILTGVGAKYAGSIRNNGASIPLYEKEGNAVAIYIPPGTVAAALETKKLLGMSITELESYLGKGDAIPYDKIGFKSSEGEVPPVVLKYEMDAGGFIFWLFEGKVEGVAIALLRPFTQEGVDRFLGIFADGQTWRKEQPVYPEIPFQWQRSDGRYYAVASMEKGTFMVANSEKIRPIPAK